MYECQYPCTHMINRHAAAKRGEAELSLSRIGSSRNHQFNSSSSSKTESDCHEVCQTNPAHKKSRHSGDENADSFPKITRQNIANSKVRCKIKTFVSTHTLVVCVVLVGLLEARFSLGFVATPQSHFGTPRFSSKGLQQRKFKPRLAVKMPPLIVVPPTTPNLSSSADESSFPTTAATATKSTSSELPLSVRELLHEAQQRYEETFAQTDASQDNDNNPHMLASYAPGRVNLIGEHVDYTGGYVLPLAIDRYTLCYGTASFTTQHTAVAAKAEPTLTVSVVSTLPHTEVVTITDKTRAQLQPLPREDKPAGGAAWTNYVVGVLKEYMVDVPPHTHVTLKLSISSNVPHGSGLSSSAALEVAVANFFESALSQTKTKTTTTPQTTKSDKDMAIARALRCQTAERQYCSSPCGIMDQFVISAACSGCALLIDCTKIDYTPVRMLVENNDTPDNQHKKQEDVVVVICNSGVKHSIAGGEYPIRVRQCEEATAAIQSYLVAVDDASSVKVQTLRDATMEIVQNAKPDLLLAAGAADEGEDDVLYRRARHVVSENARVLQAAEALTEGNYERVGELMDLSHASMRDDYEVSCEEIDILVKLAQNYPSGGVYGSRLTGGGFGGCTVTLVKKDQASALMDYLQKQYSAHYDGKRECGCFVTSPTGGVSSIDL